MIGQAIGVIALIGLAFAIYEVPVLRPPGGIALVFGFGVLFWRFIEDAPEWLKNAVFLVFLVTAGWDVYLHRSKSGLGIMVVGLLHSGSASCGGPAPPAQCDE